MRPPAGNIRQTKTIEHFVHSPVPLDSLGTLRREHQVLANGHVRKQRIVLKHVSAAPILRDPVDAGFGIEQQHVIEQECARGPVARTPRCNRAPASSLLRWDRKER